VRKILTLISLALCVGCSTVTTSITPPGHEPWVIVSKTDSVVTMLLPDGTTFTIDNQGKASAFEWFFVNVLAKTDVQVGDNNND